MYDLFSVLKSCVLEEEGMGDIYNTVDNKNNKKIDNFLKVVLSPTIDIHLWFLKIF